MIKYVINSFLSLCLFLQTLNAEEVTISTSINLDEYQNQQSSFCRPQSNKQNLEWYENFETNNLSKHDWNYSKGNSFVHKGNVIGGWGNNELQFYRIGRGSNNINSNLFIEDGLLKIQPIHHGSGYRGHSFTSARINTKSKISFTYPSRITFCFKVPSGIGFWPAFWLMPDKDSDWPKGGEIDIMENRGRITNVSSSALHFGYKWNNKATLVGEAIIPSQVNFQDAFHSITLEWYEDSLSFYMDSDPSPYFVVSSDMDIFKKFGYPFNSSFYLIINVAVGGIYDNYLVDKEAFCKNSSCSNKIDPDRSRFLIDWIEYESLKN